MKTILLKPRQVAMLLLGIAVAMTACEPEATDITEGTIHRKSRVERMIDNNIIILANTKDWQKAQKLYGEIKHDVENRRLKSKVRDDFRKLSSHAYCLCMDSIMYFHLASDCKPYHNELKEIHEVRNSKDFADTSMTAFHKQVEGQYADHQKLKDTIIPDLQKSKQSPTSFKSTYNIQKETEAVNQANTYLAKNPTCQEIRDGLTKIKNGDYFNGWRSSFCQRLVNFYLQKTEWNERDENILEGNLSFYTEKHPNSEKVKEWKQQIEEFRIIHQQDTIQIRTTN